SMSPSPESSPAPSPRKRGRPQLTPLEPYRDHIIDQFKNDVPIIDIARRLNLEHGLDVSERTISRRLTAWDVPRKKLRTPSSQELRDRVIYHYNKNLNDEQIAAELLGEGFEIKSRSLARLRQKLGLRRRSKYPEFREYSESEDEAPSAHLESEAGQSKTPPAKKRKKAAKPKFSSALIPKVTAFVEKYMSKYDGSHDFNHIRRVVGLAHLIYTEMIKEREESLPLFDETPDLDLHIVTLSALLHDVGDKKYLEPGQDGNTLVLATLLGFGAPEELAIKVQRIVLGVSYSGEIKDPAQTMGLIQRYPELAIVQDADRLDAIGAVGIGRTFTFGGAKGARHMGETIQHFEDKLEKLEGMMKTNPGRRIAKERTERLKTFKGWWEEEQKDAEGLLRKK
ncbi:Uncharacterized protein LOCC1_G001624, partial [Lachnellula occidentalis]